MEHRKSRLVLGLAMFLAGPAVAQKDTSGGDDRALDQPDVTPLADTDDDGTFDVETPETAQAGDGSNPLASVNKIDLKPEYFDLGDDRDRTDLNLEVSLMLHEKFKLVIELHYWSTDITGDRQDDFESVSFKGIFFPYDTSLNETWGFRFAIGGEVILDFDNADKGIGTGSDQIAPLVGFAFMNRETKTTILPVVQHFLSVDGDTNINTTGFRLIVIQPLAEGWWVKGDLRTPYDWENDAIPATLEVELGKMLSPNFGLFGTSFTGFGGDRPYEWGIGAGVRFRF